MVKMKRISDFPDYKNCIIGYFRIRTTRVKDVVAEQLYQKFTNVTFVVAQNNSEYLDSWLRYQAHIFLMDEFKNKRDLFLTYIQSFYIAIIHFINYLHSTKLQFDNLNYQHYTLSKISAYYH